MSDKKPCIRMSIPTHISYTLGMTFRNVMIQTHPTFHKFLNLKEVHTDDRKLQDIEVLNVLNLISSGKLEVESDSDSDSESGWESDSD